MEKKIEPIRLENNSESSEVRSERTKNFIARIMCLVVAFIIWFYAMGTNVTVYDKEITVPIEIENESVLNSNTGYSVISGKNNSVTVKVEGRRNAVNRLSERDIKATVNVAGITTSGRHVLDLVFDVAGECTVTESSVSSLAVYVDKKVSATVEVKVLSNHSFDLQYDLVLEANPSTVTVEGPSTELANIKEAQATLSLGEVTSSFTGVYPLRLIDKNGNDFDSSYVTLKTPNINITGKLYTIKDVPLEVDFKYGYFNDKNVKTTITPSFVTLRGEPSELNKLEKLTLATLDEKMYENDSTAQFPIDIPDSIQNMSPDRNATVKLEHINTTQKEITVNKENIRIINANGMNCETVTESLNIKLRGPYDLISKITSDDVSVTVDMKNYGSGTGETSMPATIGIATAYSASVYEVGSYQVTVSVK